MPNCRKNCVKMQFLFTENCRAYWTTFMAFPEQASELWVPIFHLSILTGGLWHHPFFLDLFHFEQYILIRLETSWRGSLTSSHLETLWIHSFTGRPLWVLTLDQKWCPRESCLSSNLVSDDEVILVLSTICYEKYILKQYGGKCWNISIFIN